MAQKQLNMTVVLGGKVDNSFTQIGNILSGLGNTVNGVSRYLIDFGKQSIDVYRNYEDSMLDAQVALSTVYGKGTRELSAVMTQLDAQATEWAASTIFHTNDVGNAIAQAAHANWDLEKILEGIPAAMELAQAGSIDLSQAIDYIVKSTNSMGIEFQDVGSFIDEWTYAANSSAGTVETFGDAMLRMGKTMTFAQNREELLSMLAILHDAGTTGSAAGTLLRNTMIRLVAPTDKADEAMAKLKLTQADVDEAMREVDGDTAAAIKTLQKMGFSAYDKNGNLKSFLQIFSDLALVTEKMSEEQRNDILSAIFPTRTITGALALLDELSDGTSTLYENLMSGKAEGYGEYGAKTMMSGLTGAIETLSSKWEKLKQVTGEALSDDVEDFASWAGGFIDKVSNMPEGPFNALVGGLKGIALTGPGLLVAGKGFELVGTVLGSTTGKIALGAAAVTALYGAIREYNEVEFENKFGNLSLDMEPLQKYVDSVSAPFNQARSDINEYKKAIQEAIEEYTSSSAELSSGLITKMTTGARLTGTEKIRFENLGDSMYRSVRDGIEAAYNADMEAFSLASGGEDVNDPMFSKILAVMETGYGAAIAKADDLSAQLKTAMTSAFDDGILSPDELSNIQEYMQQLNELLTIETDTIRFAEQQRQLHKAQTLGIENAQQIADMVSGSRDTQLGYIEDDRANMLGRIQALYEAGFIDDDAQKEMASWVEESTKRRIGEANDAYNGQLLRTFDNALKTSDLGDVYGAMQDTIDSVEAGGKTFEEAYGVLSGLYNPGDIAALSRFLEIEIDALGGAAAVSEQARYYRENGDEANASAYDNLLTLWGISTKNNVVHGSAKSYEIQDELTQRQYEREHDVSATRASLQAGEIDTANIGYFMSELANPNSVQGASELWSGGYLNENDKKNLLAWTDAASQIYDLNAVLSDSPLVKNGGAAGYEAYKEMYAAWQLLNMSDEDATKYSITPEEKKIIDDKKRLESINTTIANYEQPNRASGNVQYSQEAPQSLYDEKARLEKEIKYLESLSGYSPEAIKGQEEYAQYWQQTQAISNDQLLTTDLAVSLNADSVNTARSQAESTLGTPIDMTVAFPNAQSAAAEAASTIKSEFQDTINVNVKVNTQGGGSVAGSVPDKGMAEGGRADEPVLFGEAGPEWFIPEAHTDRTASLLMQAAEASGYTWAEIAELSGAKKFAYGGVVGNSEFSVSALGGIEDIPVLDWGELTPVTYTDSGGGSDDGQASPINVTYSPTINAESADDIEHVLSEDKDRLKQMLEDLLAERELIESVSRYR